MKFAEAAGFMSAEEAAMARKTGGKGPSGCKGRNECEAFCNNPDNQETCFNFGKEHGLIPEADLRQMEEGRQKFQESLNQAPPEVKECLGAAMGAEQMEKFQSGAVMPGREIGDKMRECFEKNMGPAGGPKFIGPPIKSNGQMPMEMTGPGGCKTSEECKTYCETNPEECKNFQVPTRDMRGDASIGIPERMPEGPGGCLTKEECQSYCQFHLEECQRFYSAPTIPMGPQIPSSIEGQEFPEGTAPNGMMPPEGVMPPPSTLISPELLFGLILNILFNF